MAWNRRIKLALCALLGSVFAAQAEIHVVGSEAELAQILETDLAGDELHLAPGDYAWLDFERRTAPAVIRSTDPDNPARVGFLRLDGDPDRNAGGCDGVTITQLHLAYAPEADAPNHARPFEFLHCTGLTLSDLRLSADTRPDGSRAGYAFFVGHSDGVVFDRLYIWGFHRGGVIGATRDFTIRNSEITQVQVDGLSFNGVQDITIEGNYFHDFARDPGAGDHSDMIQFFTRNTTEPSTDILIRDNLLHSGAGLGTQSIFMRNDRVDRGEAGLEMFYRNVTIEENVIINRHIHGITLGETVGVTIRRNTVLHNAHTTAAETRSEPWLPQIIVAPTSRRVTIQGNIAATIGGAQGQVDWIVADNLLVQPLSSLQPGFYGRVFQGLPGGDPLGVSSYMYRPDGLAARPDIGAARLQPGG